MSDALCVTGNEVKNFLHSDRSVFIVYGVLVTIWSFLISSTMIGAGYEAQVLWWIFFSVIVSGVFSNTVFIAERLTGAMEVLLTCGLSRTGILMGKLLFVMLMSMGMGGLCYGLGTLWTLLAVPGAVSLIGSAPILDHAVLYTAACFMSAACGAWLSLRLANPRLSHFANLFILGLIVGAYSVALRYVYLSEWLLAGIIAVIGALFLGAARKDFHTERVIQPLNY